MSDDETLRFYADNAAAYAARSRPAGPRLDAFLAALPPGARILELGTGSGQDAAHMLSRGFDVTPSDGSPELAAQARALLGIAVRVMAFSELDETAAYDGVWASASLLHAPRAGFTGIIAGIHRAMRPDALFVASYKAGNGEGRDGFGRYYNYFDAPTLAGLYRAAAPWSSFAIEAQKGSGYDNLPTDWLWVSARR